LNGETNNVYKKIKGSLLIFIINFFVFSLGFISLIIYIQIIFFFFDFQQILHVFFLPFFITFGLYLTVIYQLLISGLIIHVFNIKYKPGVYPYNFQNSMSFRWILVCILYNPLRKIIEIIPVGSMKYVYLRLLGMKIGENTLVGGTIKDPCLTEFGDNVTMGEYSIVYGHIQDFENEIISMDKVKIGNNCVIGAGVIIMPGVTFEDNVKLAAGAVVPKGKTLKKNTVYAGVPAKEIKKKKLD
jgi:acetyltransferase-like isoleucine patch superfamily enzyme